VLDERGIAVDWTLGDGAVLRMRGNYSGTPLEGLPPAPGALLFQSAPALSPQSLPAWSGLWTIA
jgi:hypothetical protein